MTKGEVMEFLKGHKTDILYLTIAGVMGAVTYRAGVKHVYKNHAVVGDNIVAEVLGNADDVYGTKKVRYADTTTPMGFKPSELGKLGEAMSETAIKNKVELPDIFTHFIAIGPETNK